MKGFFYLFIVFTFVSFGNELVAQSEDHQAKVDSLFEEISNEPVDTAKFRLYQELNKRISSVDRSTAKKTLLEQLELAQKIGDLKMIAKSHSALGSNYLYLGEAEAALPHISKAIEINLSLIHI